MGQGRAGQGGQTRLESPVLSCCTGTGLLLIHGHPPTAYPLPTPPTHPPLICCQVKYVVELAKALALHPSVYRVDLLTRLIK